MSSSLVPLKIRRVGERCTLILSKAQTSFYWCGVVVSRGGANLGIVVVTRLWFKMMRSVVKSPQVDEQCDVNIHSIVYVCSHGSLTWTWSPTHYQHCQVVSSKPDTVENTSYKRIKLL
ncbi:uncharacterized protein TNCV_4691151 [Trichonephila clavipes]|nr:uncharacterized protein TNCV_4691151 [Trichonephila clavipes]